MGVVVAGQLGLAAFRALAASRGKKRWGATCTGWGPFSRSRDRPGWPLGVLSGSWFRLDATATGGHHRGDAVRSVFGAVRPGPSRDRRGAAEQFGGGGLGKRADLGGDGAACLLEDGEVPLVRPIADGDQRRG